MVARRPRIAVLLPWTHDPENWANKYALDRVRDAEPYGYGRAADELHIEWCASQPETELGRKVRKRVARQLGFDFVHAWRNRKTLHAADVIWTHTEREHLAVALLQRLRVAGRRPKVIAQSVWLWDAWSDYGPTRRLFISWLLRAQSIELVHSRINHRASDLAVPGRLVKQIPFGTSVPDRKPLQVEPTGQTLVVAVGNDADRDWLTLSRAATLLPQFRFRIASGSASAHSTEWPANARVGPTTSIRELDQLYSAASAIVVPTQRNSHASGATSLIEALAVGRPTIATAAGGLDDYASTDATLVPPGNSDALAKAITSAVKGELPEPSFNGYVIRGLTQADYVQRYVLVTKWILGLTSYPLAAFEFVDVAQPGNAGGKIVG